MWDILLGGFLAIVGGVVATWFQQRYGVCERSEEFSTPKEY